MFDYWKLTYNTASATDQEPTYEYILFDFVVKLSEHFTSII